MLFPPEKKININGDWSIDMITVDKEDKHIAGSFIIWDNHLTIRGVNLIEQDIEEADFTITKDYVEIKVTARIHILPPEPINYSGTYKIHISSTVEGFGERAAFNYKLTLVSKNKTIILHRYEPVKWQKRLSRGRP